MFQALEHKISLGEIKFSPVQNWKCIVKKGTPPLTSVSIILQYHYLLYKNCNFWGKMLKFKMRNEIFTFFSCGYIRK